MSKNKVTTASLADYAATINDEHRSFLGCAQLAIGHAKNAGEVLIKVKAALKHGEWLPWLTANVEVSERSARGYMSIAANWAQLSAKSATVADLTLRGALDALSKPKPAALPKSVPVADLGDEPKSAEPADLPAEPEPPKPAKPIKPAEVEKIQAELEEANSTIQELASQQQPLQDEVEFLRKIETEGDKLAAACAEVKRLQSLVRVQEERIRGLMNEKREAVSAAKMWKAKFEKAERAAA